MTSYWIETFKRNQLKTILKKRKCWIKICIVTSEWRIGVLRRHGCARNNIIERWSIFTLNSMNQPIRNRTILLLTNHRHIVPISFQKQSRVSGIDKKVIVLITVTNNNPQFLIFLQNDGFIYTIRCGPEIQSRSTDSTAFCCFFGIIARRG